MHINETRFQCGIRLLTLLPLAAFALVFLVVAFSRAVYPYDLDFLEDDVLLEAWRFAQGLPVFLPPNADFVPHAYAPLYMLLSAGLFKLFGTGYLVMRLLSLAATLASAVILYMAARQLGSARSMALFAPGLLLAGFGVTGFEYDLARVDALAIALMLAGTLAGIAGARSRRGRIASALLLALAFWAKQNASLFGPAMALYLLWIARREAWDYWLVYVLAIVVPLGGLHALTGGWSTTYLLIVPQADPVALDRIVSYLRHDLPRGMGALLVLFIGAMLLAFVPVASTVGREGNAPSPALPVGGLKDTTPSPALAAGEGWGGGLGWLLFLLLAVIVSGWARARLGGNTNSLMPAYAFLCLAPCIVFAQAGQRLKPRLWADADRPPAWTGKAAITAMLPIAVYLAVLLQCALAFYNPTREMPTAAMWQGGERLIAMLRQADGPVLVLEHPYYALMAGKAPSVALTALWHAMGRNATALPSDLRARFEQRYYVLIISDEGTYPEVEALVESGWRNSYTAAQPIHATDSAATLDGLVVQPRDTFIPKQ